MTMHTAIKLPAQNLEPKAFAPYGEIIRPCTSSAETAVEEPKLTLTNGRAGATSLHQIVDALNARGITTPRGGKWYAKSTSNVLARARSWRRTPFETVKDRL
jgi:Recombinase